MRTCAKRRVMTVAMENRKAMSSASPSPIGEIVPSKRFRHHDGDAGRSPQRSPPRWPAPRSRGTAARRAAPRSAARRPASAGCWRRWCSPARRRSRSRRWRSRAPPPGPAGPCAANSRQRAAPAVAPGHEADQEDRRPERAPEHDRPAVVRSMKAGDRAAEAPHHGRQKDEQETQRLVPAQAARRTGGNGGWRRQTLAWRGTGRSANVEDAPSS